MTKKVIPFGDRILVTREKIGNTLGTEGIIVAAEETSERPTDLAKVAHVPDHSFLDKELISKSESIIKGLSTKAEEGDSEALVALLQLNQYLKIKSIRQGDSVMIGKYVGTDFETTQGEALTLVMNNDIIGLVVEDEQ